MTRIVAFTIAVETGTALVMLVDPALAIDLILGLPADAAVRVLARCFGIALLSLVVAWWPDRNAAPVATHPYFRGRLAYNGLIALFLAYLGLVEHMGGVLLWPAVVIHSLIAVLIVGTWRAQYRKAKVPPSSE